MQLVAARDTPTGASNRLGMAKPPLFAWLQEKPDSPTSNCSNGSFTFPALPQKTNSLPELEPDSHLFTTPPDLLCPITHEIFQDPVITLGAGQVGSLILCIGIGCLHKVVEPALFRTSIVVSKES